MTRSIMLLLLVSTLGTVAHGAPLDEYYLRKFRVPGATNARVTGVGVEAGTPVVERCRTWLYHDLRRDWSRLEPQTQKVLAKVLPARPVFPDEQTVLSPGGNFLIHYTLTGNDAAPSVAWVNTVAQTMEDVRTYMVNTLGYAPAPTPSGAYDVYLSNVGSPPPPEQGIFGETASETAITPTSFTSYMVIDNDFSAAEFGRQIRDYTPDKALQITAAHEYHHAIQFGYNFFFEGWYAEATSTWVEDEIYDNVNQLYNYLPAYMENSRLSIDIRPDVSLGGGYGRWIFNRHLAERFGLTVVREVWERLGTMPPPANVSTDIPMLPVIGAVLTGRGSNLDREFFLFTKKLYDRKWESHQSEIEQIHPVVRTAYSSYPVNASSTPAPTVTLPHYAFEYFLFQPSTSAPADLAIDVSQTAGMQSTGFRRTTADVIAEFPPDGTGVIIIPSFRSGTVEGALLVSNSSASDQQTANFSTDNSTPPPTAAPVASGGGGGGGCFIATAAFGSYLHPKVQVLREFRDEFLLTNAPGMELVGVYYRLSPPIAAIIGRHEGLRAFSRFALTPVIAAVEHPRVAGLTLFGGAAASGVLLIWGVGRLRRAKYDS